MTTVQPAESKPERLHPQRGRYEEGSAKNGPDKSIYCRHNTLDQVKQTNKKIPLIRICTMQQYIYA